MSVLDYASPQQTPPRWRLALYHLRFVLLAGYAMLLGGALAFWLYAGAEAVGVAIVLLIFLGVQGMFLIGMPQLRWPRPTRRRRMWISLVAGAAVAAVLTFGLLGTALSGVDWWRRVNASIFWVIPGAWAVWIVLFGVMWTGEWLGGFKRMYWLLVAGTWLELLVTIPVDVQVRKRTDCWCGEGTFFALVISSTVAAWSFGPGLVLLFLTRRLQRDGYFSLCRKCGRDLQNDQGRRCPGCGARVPRHLRARVGS